MALGIPSPTPQMVLARGSMNARRANFPGVQNSGLGVYRPFAET